MCVCVCVCAFEPSHSIASPSPQAARAKFRDLFRLLLPRRDAVPLLGPDRFIPVAASLLPFVRANLRALISIKELCGGEEEEEDVDDDS